MSRSAILLSILGALLVTVGWYLLLVKPTQDRIAEARTQIEEADAESFRLAAQRAALQRIEDNMLAYLAALGEIEQSIPVRPQTASLIDDLSALADETGVLWESGSYGNPTMVEGAQYLEIPVNVTIQGQFFEVLGYLYGIADMDRLVRIETIGISPAQDENNFTILTVTIAARAFTSSDVGIPVPEGEGEPTEPEEPAEAPADGEEGSALVGAL